MVDLATLCCMHAAYVSVDPVEYVFLPHVAQVKLPFSMQAFLEGSNVLVSGSKDGYVRAWDLGTQHCFQTVAGQQGEASWSFLEANCSLCRQQ